MSGRPEQLVAAEIIDPMTWDRVKKNDQEGFLRHIKESMARRMGEAMLADGFMVESLTHPPAGIPEGPTLTLRANVVKPDMADVAEALRQQAGRLNDQILGRSVPWTEEQKRQYNSMRAAGLSPPPQAIGYDPGFQHQYSAAAAAIRDGRNKLAQALRPKPLVDPQPISPEMSSMMDDVMKELEEKRKNTTSNAPPQPNPEPQLKIRIRELLKYIEDLEPRILGETSGQFVAGLIKDRVKDLLR